MALPEHVPSTVRTAVAEAHRLRALYGTPSRGDAHDESDVDLLVVLRGDSEPRVERKRTSRVWHALPVAYGRAVSIKPFSVAEAADETRPLMWNDAREGGSL